MAIYRRTMNIEEEKYLHSKFKGHLKTRGGIFMPAMRHRLIGVRGEKNNQVLKPDTADFWQNVRDYTKAAIWDLELLATVAENDQLKDIFSVREDSRDWDASAKKYKRPDPLAYLNLLLRHEHREEWRTRLGIALVSMGIQWRGMYSKKLTNKLITDAFENAKAAAELLGTDSPAAPLKARKKPISKNPKN